MTRNFEDGLNLKNERNIFNTPRDLYNCGGYAFNTFSWLFPGIDEDREIMIQEAMFDNNYEEAIQLSVEDLLKQFPDYKVVASCELQQYPADKYAIIAFRVNNLDYHFWKLGRNGRWYEKRGATPRIHVHSFNDVWAPWGRADGLCYDSEITFFVKKRS